MPGDIGEALCELLDAHSCDDGLLNRYSLVLRSLYICLFLILACDSSSRDDYSTKRSRVEPPSSSGDEEYNNNMWGHYPPAVYSNQDDLSRFHLAQQGGYGVEQEKYLQFNSWGLPLESPLASTLTDDDFLNMVVAYLLVTYLFVNHIVGLVQRCLWDTTGNFGENICCFILFFNIRDICDPYSTIYYLYISGFSSSFINRGFLKKHHELWLLLLLLLLLSNL